MMRGLEREAGEFRSGPVGVVNQAGQIVHFGTLPRYVPEAVANLLDWVRSSELPMLIRSCVFHYEFELIHPFADGNGRMDRLWHTLLLSKRNPLFAWLPVESIVYDRQREYYEAIKASLTEAVEVSDEMSDAPKDRHLGRWEQIENFLKDHAFIQNADVQHLFGVSSATANRLLARLTAEGKLMKYREGGHWAYRRIRQYPELSQFPFKMIQFFETFQNLKDHWAYLR